MSIEINGDKYITFDNCFNDENKVSKDVRTRIELETALIGKIILAKEEKKVSK